MFIATVARMGHINAYCTYFVVVYLHVDCAYIGAYGIKFYIFSMLFVNNNSNTFTPCNATSAKQNVIGETIQRCAKQRASNGILHSRAIASQEHKVMETCSDLRVGWLVINCGYVV